jgi:hypothetical protein
MFVPAWVVNAEVTPKITISHMTCRSAYSKSLLYSEGAVQPNGHYEIYLGYSMIDDVCTFFMQHLQPSGNRKTYYQRLFQDCSK